MAAIVEWEKDLKKKDYASLIDIQTSLRQLEDWKFFEKEYPQMKILRVMVDEEIKRRNENYKEG